MTASRVRASTSSLATAERDEALALVAAVAAHDGVSPLNEASRLALTHSGDAPVLHVRAYVGDALVGYLFASVPAELPPPDRDGTVAAPMDRVALAECCVAPAHRRGGVGTALVAALLAETMPEVDLQVWAHGDLPGAGALAAGHGFAPARTLLELALDLDAAAPPSAPGEPPDGVRVRTFQPGADEDALVALNARAFAHHPEQAEMTRRDLEQRMAEDWFDAEGFFVAEQVATGELVAFHWTKVELPAPGRDAEGEVYVVGVDPDAQGLGLGTLMTRVGLHHLAGRGLRRITLYVEGDNDPALAIYRRQGFTDAARDVLYARRAEPFRVP